MPARSKLSKLMDDTSVAYIEAYAEDKEFHGLRLLTVARTEVCCAELYGRSAKDYPMKTGKSPPTRYTKRLLSKRVVDRNMVRVVAAAAAAF